MSEADPKPPGVHIRPGTSADLPGIRQIYPLAFPDEDLLPLIDDLSGHPDVIGLVATANGDIAGHVLFTIGHAGANRDRIALLAPMAVAPTWQRQGIGSALVRDGLQRLEQVGVAAVCVLGDPAYYGRLGFEQEPAIRTPCPIPEAWHPAWQSQPLGASAALATGPLILPDPWLQPELWAP